MSLEQSKKIVEAAGEVRCDCEQSIALHDLPSHCRLCGRRIEIHDLSLPENRHLLVGYVVKICDTETKRMGMEDALNERLARVTFCPYDFDIIVASSETLVDALCQVIDESQ